MEKIKKVDETTIVEEAGYVEPEEEIIIEDILGKQTVKIGDKTIIRVNGEDIAGFGPNGEVLFCELPRVDIEDPNSIIEYGSEYISSISNLLKEVSRAAIADDSTVISDELINSMDSFDENMEEARKKREKEEKLPALVKNVINVGKTFLTTIGFEQMVKDSELTDENCYKQYCNRILELTNGVVQQAESCNKDMQLRGSAVKDMMPLIHKLYISVKVGEKDLETYEAETQRLENGQFSMDITFEVDRRKNNAEQFLITLGDLRKDLALYETKIGGDVAQQQIDMSIIRTSARWVKTISPILEANANLNLFNYRQAKRLILMAKIDEAGNKAIAESGNNIKANADLAVKLETEGGIRLDTIKGVHAQVLEGSKVLAESQKKLVARIEKEKGILEQITAEETAMQGRLASQSAPAQLLLEDGKAPVKSIGAKPSTYRGR